VGIGLAVYVARSPMDFRVYYFGAIGVFTGTLPVYGLISGFGWPMHYRYPPLFVLLVYPLTLLPLAWAAALWTLLRWGAIVLVAERQWKRLGPGQNHAAWLVPLFLAGPYVIEDARYGNAQTLVFALTAAALLLVETRPRLAAAALALGISIKVWPLYFVPYLAVRREWRIVGWTLALTALLALLPSLYFGFQDNLILLGQWARQEYFTQTAANEIWFPSQSLRGVLMRYLTVVDYSQVPDSNYPLVHVAALDPATVRTAWMALAAALYCGFLALTRSAVRRPELQPEGLTEALAFSSLILLQPFSQKYTLVVLLWPAMVAGRLYGSHRGRMLIYAAAAIAFLQPLVQGAATQRLLHVLGFDFLATALLTAVIVMALLRPVSAPGAERRYYSPGTRTP
jgi:hypothetical protein